MTDGRRPTPEEMLARAEREESRARRGRLKVFFGAAPGVGKTYAMLGAAQALARDGIDIVIGLVETHGRTETEQQLLGLDILPRRTVGYRGTTLHELDLEAALARRPEILVVDELAHTNAPGGRFPKRWQDVQELLKAGINVYTTLNVQHIESLSDVVAQITRVQVRETVPDAVLEEADEIELVDLPPGVLLERLKAGKVYVPESIAPAMESFFRAGNLTALRELALRRTAELVERQMQHYKQGQGIRTGWPAGERILVAVSPSPLAAKLVRAAKRMAAGLHADLIAVYVEPPGARLTPADRDRVLQTLRLAESLGAQTTTLGGRDPAAELVAFARSRNASKIVVGKTGRSRLGEAIFGSFVNDLIRSSADADVYVIRGDADARPEPEEGIPAPRRRSAGGPVRYAWAVVDVLVCTVIGKLVFEHLAVANIVMIYLAGVVVAAVRLGRGPAVLAALLGVAAFDFFFVPPSLTFAVSDVQYLLTFAVMLLVGLLIANLTTRLRDLADTARDRERRTSLLYAMSRELAAAQGRREVALAAARHMHDTFDADAAVLVPSLSRPVEMEVLASAGAPDWLDERERGVGRWAFDHGKSAGLGTPALPAAAGRYQPLWASQGKAGVLAIRPRDTVGFTSTSQLLLLDTFANQIALALERVALIEGQQTAKIQAESERLRSALLSSVSHDLRTPLAAIAGAASTLRESEGGGEGGGMSALDAGTRRELADSIVQEAQRLSDLIANLLFATRLDTGTIDLKREWTTVEEIVGAGLARHREGLAARPFLVRVRPDLPMIRVDNAMMPQVVHNLVENALRYTPPGTRIEVSAWATDTSVVVKVADEGPGLGEGEAGRVFQRFYRGRSARAGSGGTADAGASGGGGMGLGLTICDGIIKAHGGRIWAEPNRPAGVAFLFSLPIERPQPMVPREPEASPLGKSEAA
jgi:two-component system sensor histidine kinase KdpD